MITTNYGCHAVATLAVALCLAAVPVDAMQQQQQRTQLSKSKTKEPLMRRQRIEIGPAAGLTSTRLQNTHKDYQGIDFQLKTAVGQNHLKIPKLVILTGPFKSFAEALQRRGKLDSSPESLGITPDLHVRYFDNPACRAYLEQHFPKLVAPFDAEKHGSYRGDICRTAVLAREGGFYVDLDMELRTPLQKIVDDETTFMTARSAYGGALNALIATMPNNPVMLDTLAHIEKWYRNETSQEGLLGPVTMQHALEDTMKLHCPQHHWANVSSQFKCGPFQSVRLFTEELIGWGDCSSWRPTICPKHRAESSLSYAKFGLFDGPKYGMGTIKSPSSKDIATREEKMIGWPRFEACAALGCGLSGGVAS